MNSQFYLHSLKKIKSLGLLDREFLNILPIQNDLFEFYEKFSISLKDMMNNEELIPTHDGTFCAGKAVRGTQRLRSLLNVNDLKFLNGYMLTKFSNWILGHKGIQELKIYFNFLKFLNLILRIFYIN